MFDWVQKLNGIKHSCVYYPSKNRPGIPAEFQRNSRSSLDSGWSPPEFRVTETRNSGFRWIPGSEFWSPADSGIRVLESGGIPGLEFCHVMAFQSRVRSPAESRVWSSGLRLKIWGPAEFQTLVLLHLSAVITDAWMPWKFSIDSSDMLQNLAKTSCGVLFLYTKWQWSVKVHTSSLR